MAGKSAQATEEMTSTVNGLISEMEALQTAYEESHAKAVESIEGQLGLFNDLDGTAKTSIDSLIETLKGQVSYMETYAANIQKAMELGVDEGLVKSSRTAPRSPLRSSRPLSRAARTRSRP